MNKPLKENSARVFFALWPDETESQAFTPWQTSLHEICGGRTMRAETLHVTLVFIGEIELHRLEALQLAGQETEGKVFELTFNSAHYWGHNNIVYASPDNVPAQLVQLVHDLEQRLNQHQFRFDKREYKPHVTLQRHSKWNDSALPDMKKLVWQIKNFALVQSVPDENGANYSVLARFQLN